MYPIAYRILLLLYIIYIFIYTYSVYREYSAYTEVLINLNRNR